jgi:hypothetical protein
MPEEWFATTASGRSDCPRTVEFLDILADFYTLLNITNF